MGDSQRGGLGEDIRAYWDERAVTYSNGVLGELSDDRRKPWERVIARETAGLVGEALRGSRRPRALDLGCGPGFFEILLGSAGWQVNAVDNSVCMLRLARANTKAAGLDQDISFAQSDFARLPYEDGAFDLVVSRNVTWLMREPKATYAEWLRVLRTGGKLLVFDANWYRYLVDLDVDAVRRRDQEGNVLEGWDEQSMATSDEEKRCEELAAKLPLTPILRPAWDIETLRALGATDVQTDEGAWLELWSHSEQTYYGSTPLFLVKAAKART